MIASAYTSMLLPRPELAVAPQKYTSENKFLSMANIVPVTLTQSHTCNNANTKMQSCGKLSDGNVSCCLLFCIGQCSCDLIANHNRVGLYYRPFPHCFFYIFFTFMKSFQHYFSSHEQCVFPFCLFSHLKSISHLH